MATTGRRTKLTKKTKEQIVNYIKKGNYATVAARASGIGESTYFLWMDKGRKDTSEGLDTIYADFLEAVERAEAEAEVYLVGVVYDSAPENAKNALEILKRKYNSRWMDKTYQNIEATVDTKFEVVNVTYDQNYFENLERKQLEAPKLQLEAAPEYDEEDELDDMLDYIDDEEDE